MLGVGSIARFILQMCKIFGIVAEQGNFAAVLINISVLLRAAHSYSFCFSLASIAIERCLATYFLRDYEQRSRKAVRILLVSVSLSISMVLGGISVYRDLTDIDLPYVTSIILCSTIVICYLHWYNYRKMMQSTKWNLPYTLSFRFQLQENIRVFKMLRYLYLTASVTAFLAVGLLFIAVKCRDQICGRLVDAIYQLVISICGSITTVVCAVSVPQWRLQLRKHLPLWRPSPIQNAVSFRNDEDASLLRYLYIAAIITTLVAAGLTFANVRCLDESCARLTSVAYEISKSICGCTLLLVCFLSVPQWRSELKRWTFFRRKIAIHNIVSMSASKEMTAVYFRELKNFWR
ncbi:hypothetical protein Y032_0003g1198 [Ancylostoma ceylanicum]|nr:hypothetical protein Y032_0003g1198 [Ancylostoma ceylanicum]